MDHSDAATHIASITLNGYRDSAATSKSSESVDDAYAGALKGCLVGLFETESIHITVVYVWPCRDAVDVEWTIPGWFDLHNNPHLHMHIDMNMHGDIEYLTPFEFELAFANNANSSAA